MRYGTVKQLLSYQENQTTKTNLLILTVHKHSDGDINIPNTNQRADRRDGDCTMEHDLN